MSYEFDTLAIHSGQPNDEKTGAVTFPIYQTTTYEQIEPGVNKGYCYSRTGNPTRTALEELLASLEGARYGFAVSSGIAAVNTCLSILKTGDEVITCKDLYGGSYRIFTKVFAKYGINFKFVDTTRPQDIARALTPQTKLLWLETPSNPLLAITDIAAASAVVKPHGVTVVVDNTFATPYLQHPLAHGADIVLHSTTKYLNGHGDVLGGALITDDEALAEQLRFFQNALGATPAPQDCFLTLRGAKTLGVRMDRHCSNARRVAEFLAQHPSVSKVHYPGFTTHPNHAVAAKQMRDFGGIVSFELNAGVEDAKRFTTQTQLFTLAESLGSVKSLLCHPPTMTHAAVEPEVRRKHGIPDGLIRLSVGIEDARDLVADLKQALASLDSSQAA
jgi:cystathionine gamma-lyase